ncbi:hypothetical protein BXU11_04260 [Flavobacterium sp. LM5]|uniref:ABC-three component system protein n=1 Tax=Flavobacterium sp. LM5 TaxID=1938610 RepID=UPI0009926384|nr:ABC-three component system protein [Flavobacterium sp. LM5]OOV29144.1 hypothetical protein BXU11_04260 [Flavobacterium sp. LM5]
MEENDLKRYTVILGSGSGILFQPLDESKTYVLSAKHVFYDKDNTGHETKYTLKHKINLCFFNTQNELKEIEITNGVNYFEHSDADNDSAILILNENLGYNQIFVDEDCIAFNECLLCGYPSKIDDNKNDRYSNHQINRKIDTTNNGYFRLETNFGNLNHEDIIGFSGGGILRLSNGMIHIVGIQSSTTTDYANGQIDVVPISKFLEIVEENKDKLSEMIPQYLSSFEFLKSKVFDFSAGSDEEDIILTKSLLKRKAIEVINSDITPSFIKNHFKDKLLINENDLSNLKDELIYITWLEFLTFLNIVKTKTCTTDELIEVQSIIRLLCKMDETEWLGDNFIKDCLSFNYDDLGDNGTVFIKTKSKPSKIKDYSIPKGAMISSIASIKNSYLKGVPVYDGAGADIFNAESETKEFIFDKYNFIHFEYLKYVMLVENSGDYRHFTRLTENELLIKLKEEYGKVFGI